AGGISVISFIWCAKQPPSPSRTNAPRSPRKTRNGQPPARSIYTISRFCRNTLNPWITCTRITSCPAGNTTVIWFITSSFWSIATAKNGTPFPGPPQSPQILRDPPVPQNNPPVPEATPPTVPLPSGVTLPPDARESWERLTQLLPLNSGPRILFVL